MCFSFTKSTSKLSTPRALSFSLICICMLSSPGRARGDKESSPRLPLASVTFVIVTKNISNISGASSYHQSKIVRLMLVIRYIEGKFEFGSLEKTAKFNSTNHFVYEAIANFLFSPIQMLRIGKLPN